MRANTRQKKTGTASGRKGGKGVSKTGGCQRRYLRRKQALPKSQPARAQKEPKASDSSLPVRVV